MPSRQSRGRRLLLPTLLAAVLVGEITGLALARSLTPTVASIAAPATAVAIAAARDADRPSVPKRSSTASTDAARDAIAVSANAARVRDTVRAGGPVTMPVSDARSTTTSTKSAPSRPAKAPAVRPAAASPSYQGRNHVWIPSLGINKQLQSFPCSRSRPPDAGVYRWGCAGRNNVYLLAHAWSTFKPLHDAFVGGRLRKGMKAYYADNAGRVRTYSVIWWRVTAPTTAASWAWAAQSRPSMTLQTCVGSRSQDRLMVRLVQVV